jgi:hypothetical protein
VRTNELGTFRTPVAFERALTDVIRSRRLVAETERQLSEALVILRMLDGPSSSWRASEAERATWTQDLDESIRQLADVRGTLHSLLDGSASSDA